MKKLTMMVSVIGLLLAVAPMKASAVSFTDDGSGNFCNSADFSGGGKFGTFKKGDVCYKYTDTTNGIKEWTVYLTPTSNVKTLYYEIQPSSTIEIQSIKVNSAFLKAGETKTETGTRLLLFPTNPSGLTSGSKVLLFTITTKDLASEGCYLNFSPLSLPSCQVVEGNYFDKNGNQISKTEYDEVCAGLEPDNPQTGNVIPYVAVAGGLIAIAGVYLYSRKSNKMYRI